MNSCIQNIEDLTSNEPKKKEGFDVYEFEKNLGNDALENCGNEAKPSDENYVQNVCP